MTTKDPHYFKKYYQKNKEKMDNYSKEYHRNYKRTGIKKDKKPYTWKFESRKNYFISMYGGKCKCCGEMTVEFLTLEHVQGQAGKKRETSYKAYSKAIKEYKPEIYEILCYNCNCVKAHGKICPHKLKQ